MSEIPYGNMLPNAPMTEKAKHTAKNINATDGSRTARTAAFARGDICQLDPHNHEDDTDHGIIVADPVAGFNTGLAIVDSLTNDPVNDFAEGSTTDRKGGMLNVVRGSGRVGYAKVRAVTGNIVAGDTLLTPNSAQGHRELRDAVPTTVAHLLERVGSTGAAAGFAVALENATTTETASTYKLIKVQIL